MNKTQKKTNSDPQLNIINKPLPIYIQLEFNLNKYESILTIISNILINFSVIDTNTVWQQMLDLQIKVGNLKI